MSDFPFPLQVTSMSTRCVFETKTVLSLVWRRKATRVSSPIRSGRGPGYRKPVGALHVRAVMKIATGGRVYCTTRGDASHTFGGETTIQGVPWAFYDTTGYTPAKKQRAQWHSLRRVGIAPLASAFDALPPDRNYPAFAYTGKYLQHRSPRVLRLSYRRSRRRIGSPWALATINRNVDPYQ